MTPDCPVTADENGAVQAALLDARVGQLEIEIARVRTRAHETTNQLQGVVLAQGIAAQLAIRVGALEKRIDELAVAFAELRGRMLGVGIVVGVAIPTVTVGLMYILDLIRVHAK